MKGHFAALGLAAFAVSALIPVKGQEDSALLDALVKKGVLSDAEAQDIRTSEEKAYSTTSASKIALNNSVKSLTFYGDGRLRFDGLAQNNYNYDSKNVQDRFRYRLRVGADYTYSDHLKAGFELESGTTNDSANQTLGATFTKASINVGKIYAQYQPTDWLTLTGGKFANPWYETTDMVYSFDLNPEGAAEVFTFNIPLGNDTPGGVVDPKDVKSMHAIESSDSSLTIGWNAVQYLYVTAAQSTPDSGTGIFQNNNNVGIIGNQIPVTWKINKDLTLKVAPGFTFYTNGGNTNFQGGVPTNYTNLGTEPEPGYVYGTANSSSDPTFYSPREADDLNVISAPGEFDFKIADVPIRAYWDFDWNVTGKERVQDVYLNGGGVGATSYNTGGTSGTFLGYGSVAPNGTAAQTIKNNNSALGDNVAWAVGIQAGQNKKKGDWSGLVEFRQIGLGSVDPNINGTDYANSYSNVEGFKFATAYNFTDAFTGTVTFYDDWAYKNNLYNSLGGAGTTTGPTAGTTQYLVSLKSDQRVQVDLGWKF
jgi:hypothetical protein